MNFIGFKRIGGTFAIIFYNKSKHIINNYFVQFSLKDMWKFPHKEFRYENGSWLCGWGFFYFGNIIADGHKKQKED
ncbi:TPA: hypothetical protein LA468_003333 [Clostridium botulinum]|nr:hypothetical protein [Clostridium botulinum]